MRDDLSSLPPELAGEVRECLHEIHREHYGRDLDDPRWKATYRLGFVLVTLIHVVTHEHARLVEEQRRARREQWRARWAPRVAVLALVVALISLVVR